MRYVSSHLAPGNLAYIPKEFYYSIMISYFTWCVLGYVEKVETVVKSYVSSCCDAQWIFCFSGNDEVSVLQVYWPDGSSISRTLQPGEMNSVVEVAYPKDGEVTVVANDTQVVMQDDPRHEL